MKGPRSLAGFLQGPDLAARKNRGLLEVRRDHVDAGKKLLSQGAQGLLPFEKPPSRGGMKNRVQHHIRKPMADNKPYDLPHRPFGTKHPELDGLWEYVTYEDVNLPG